MPFYPGIKKFKQEKERKRTASKLIALKEQLKSEVPQKTIDETLLLATWNLRDFDSNKFKHGPRRNESYYYIAEIISNFDLVALQEINKNLRPFKKVMSILGRNWDFISTDTTEGSSGNQERMVFVFDKSKVSFQNIAGEVVLTESKLIGGKRQFARTPFVVAFQSGWFKFMLCTVHLYYGAASGEKFERRVKEIHGIAKFLSKRAKAEKYNYIVLGDFNIVSPDHKTMQALEGSGFVIPEQLKRPTNIDKSKFYDQIAFKTKENELRLGDSANNAGVFDYYKTVFKDDEFEIYESYMSKAKDISEESKKVAYYQKKWRTFQMSDHMPMWVELKIDFSRDYLEKLGT